MIVGLLPAIRGGLRELAATGQHVRLIEGFMRPYAKAFDEVRYFSYLDESLDEFTRDVAPLPRVSVFKGHGHPWAWTLGMPFVHAKAMRRCAVLRVFQVTGVVPALIARRLWGVPFVTTYGFWYGELARTPFTRRLRRVVESAGLKAAGAVIATTPELAAHVSRRVDAAKVHVIPNGVDTTRFVPRPAPPGAQKTVLYAGRLSDEKNLGVVLEATATLTDLRVRVVFVGDGPARAGLTAQAKRLGVDLAIKPFVSHDRMPAELTTADVFVLPSLTEGHPKVLLEAMSCARACVVSDVAGNQAIVEHGKTGLLTDPRDPAAFADALKRVVGDEPFARELGENARANVIEHYDLEPLVAEEIALVTRVAQARGARG